MDIKRNGSRPSATGAAKTFTGSVRRDTVIDAPEPSRCARALSRSSRPPERPGTPIRWDTTLFVLLRARPGSEMEGNPSRRSRPGDRQSGSTTWGKALARGIAHGGHEPSDDPGGAGRLARHLARARLGRAVRLGREPVSKISGEGCLRDENKPVYKRLTPPGRRIFLAPFDHSRCVWNKEHLQWPQRRFA